MSSIDKMLIKGIRSFSPSNTHVIEFYKPLTLIVGQNGAGKTTIIECLKMACTGDLPPNTRSGQTFIHDPKVSGDTEVKGQIKLRCRNLMGKPIVVIRSFQLTQRATKMEYKALESVIQTMNESSGEKEAISHRCTDMDRLVPTMMGVSKAILENVIFVHQEEANWPLSEGAVLKKKFDDIFSATRYTKALEAIRKLRTEQAGQVREHKLKLQNVQQYLDAAERLRRSLDEDSKKSGVLREQIHAMDAEIAQLKQEESSIRARLGRLTDSQEGIKVLMARQEMTIRQTKELYLKVQDGDLDEETLSASEEDLRRTLDEFNTVLSNTRNRKGSTERGLQAKRVEAEALRERVERDILAHGKHAAEHEAHVKRVAARDNFIRSVAQRTGLAGLDPAGELGDGAARDFMAKVEEKLAQQTEAVAALRRRHREQDERKAEELEAIAREASAAEQALAMGRQKVLADQQRRAELLDEAEACMSSEAAVAAAAAAEAEAKRRHEDFRSSAAAEDIDGQIDGAEAELDGVNREQQKVRREREQAAAAQERASSLRYKREELAKKRAALEAFVSSKESRLAAALGAVPAHADIRPRCDRHAADLAKAHEAAGRDLQAAQAKSAEIGGALSAARAAESALAREAESCRERIRRGLGGVGPAPDPPDESRFGAAAEATAKEEADLRDDLRKTEVMSSLSVNLTDAAERSQCCSVCERPFRDEAEVQEFVTKIRRKHSRAPEAMRELEGRLKEAQKKIDTVNELRPVWSRYEALRAEEIPRAARQTEELEAAHQEAARATDEMVDCASAAEVEVGQARALAAEVGSRVDALLKEITAVEVEVEAQEASLEDLSLGISIRSAEEVERDAARLEDARNALEKRRGDLQGRKQRATTELAALHSAWRDAREAVQRAEAGLAKERDLRRQAGELEKACRDFEEERKALEAKAAPLAADRERALAERGRERALAQRRESEADGERSELQREVDQLRHHREAVDAFMQRGGLENLEKAKDTLERNQGRAKELEGEVRGLEDDLRNFDEQLNTRDAIRRNIEDALAYKKSKAAEEDIRVKIEQAASKVDEIGDPDSMAERLGALSQDLDRTQEKRNMMRGSASTFTQNVERHRRELEDPHYKDVDKRYKKSLIELRTTEMANQDLDKYHQALDKALMHFHTTKMAEINKIVKELWQSTYRGQDIDYIQIRSDADGAGGATSGGARNYNYRVVMRSGSAELDMRGRCSAGQKVLACLIIRLALAETFCLNCGILALDEPTTNLDGPNAASLAGALTALMQNRREQANFQLVVITHDEQFAHLIGQREHAEYYWRITKDDDQHSHIEREAIFE